MATLVLDNFVHERYSVYFSRYHRYKLDIYHASKNEFPNRLDRYDHIILSGSEESILNDKDWIDREMELVRCVVDKKIPVLGICFGHQLMARALGGTDSVRRSSKPEFGWLQVTLTGKTPLFQGIPGSFLVFNSHFDEVCNLTGDFEVLARSDHCDVQAFRVTGTPAWGIQFHPEIDTDSGLKFLRDLVNIVPERKIEIEKAIEDAGECLISDRLFGNFYDI
jgi:GMP synthase (glutamine-hydrolysing)